MVAPQNIRVALNLHPADGVSSLDNKYDAFVEHLGETAADLKCHVLPAENEARRFYDRIQAHNGPQVERIPFDCTHPTYMKAYFEVLHRPLEAEGVDLWWLDWQQGQECAIRGLDPLPWLNHLHWSDQLNNPAKADKRLHEF